MLSPKEIVQIVYDNYLEADFMSSLMMSKNNFSIAEIFDKEFVKEDGTFKLKSNTYNLDAKVADEDIVVALNQGLYVTPFVSRKDDKYGLHFMVHRYTAELKPKFEEAIAEEVIKYMIFITVISLRLDTEEKVRQYCSK